ASRWSSRSTVVTPGLSARRSPAAWIGCLGDWYNSSSPCESIAKHKHRPRRRHRGGARGKLHVPDPTLFRAATAQMPLPPDIGMVTTPMCYFAAQHLDTQCCVMVTGSHNPPDYNGLKMVIAGTTLAEGQIQDLKKRIESGDLRRGAGGARVADIVPAYIDRI